MKQLYYLIFLLLAFSCSSNKLANTKWEWAVSDNCMNYMEFKEDNTLYIYYCEPDEIIIGKYKIRNDTIYIQTIGGQYDYEFPEGSRHRHKPSSYYLILKRNSIVLPKNSEIKYIKIEE